jgi:TPR repeat protein
MDNMQELTLKAEQGDARAQFRLGMAYYNGDRIEKSQIKALKWWTKAAEQGVNDADYCLGCIYFDEK